MMIEYSSAHIAELERQIIDLNKEKSTLSEIKIAYEKNLTELKQAAKSRLNDKNAHRLIADVKIKLSEVASKILSINKKRSEKTALKSDIQQGIKDKKVIIVATPQEMRDHAQKMDDDSELRLKLLALKDRYIDFAGDHTRISSKRQMAAEFAKEIDIILKNKRQS